MYADRRMWLNWIKEGYAVVLVVLILSLRCVIRKGRQQMEGYAAEHGFKFARKINPADIDLYSTSFFGRFDSAEDVTFGDFQDIAFVHFLQHTSSGHGHKAGYRAVVMFNLGLTRETRGPNRAVMVSSWKSLTVGHSSGGAASKILMKTMTKNSRSSWLVLTQLASL